MLIKNNSINKFFDLIGVDTEDTLKFGRAAAYLFKDVFLVPKGTIKGNIIVEYEPAVEKVNQNETILVYVYKYEVIEYDDLQDKLILTDFKAELR